MLKYGRDLGIFLILAEWAGLKNGDHAFLGLDSAVGSSKGSGFELAPDWDDAQLFQGVIGISNANPAGVLWNNFYTDLIEFMNSQNMSMDLIQSKLVINTAGELLNGHITISP